MLNLLITGKSARMGQALLQAAAEEPNVTVASTHDVGEDLDAAFQKAACAIDFTVHSFTQQVIEAALKHGTSLVIGTTGHTDAERVLILEAAEKLPVVFASNYSVGVNTLFWLTRHAARILTQERFDIEVTEMHHRHKIDAPSGTARTLLEILNSETGTSYDNDVAHGRVGNIGPRKPREIGMHTLRGGDVVGDHTVIFAAGAVHAAVWLQGKSAGLYDMQDVLGLKCG